MKKLVLFCFCIISLQLSAQNSSLLHVYSILEAKCATCHNTADPQGGLDLQGTGNTPLARAFAVRNKLFNKTPINATAAAKGDLLVYEGRPDRSFLFRKINQGLDTYYDDLSASEGQPMPAYGGPGPLTDVEKETIRQWILYGAKSGGNQFDVDLIAQYFDSPQLKAFPDGPPPAPAPGEGYQIKMGPFYLPPSGEVEYYQKYDFPMDVSKEVNRVDVKISNYSHHFIIYNFESQAGANQVSSGLRVNANHSDINLVAAVQGELDLRLPEGTAFFWEKDMILDLNSHYINYSLNEPYQAEAYINIYTQPNGTAVEEMHAELLVKPWIPIPNNGNIITHTDAAFFPSLGDIHIWGLMGHTHKYGTGYKVWERNTNGTKGALLYDGGCAEGAPNCIAPNFDYQHIPMRYFEPMLPVDWGKGIIHEATYMNDGPSSVNFGPTSDDEMMVLIMFYTENALPVTTQSPISTAERMDVYPNPSSGLLNFSMKDGAEIGHIRLFDALGRLVRSVQEINSATHQMDVSTLLPGVYSFQVNGLFVGKIVVQ